MRRTHGQSESREYSIYLQMKGRCKNPKLKSFKNYGGRGIRVCERWINSFENFIADMGRAPSPKHSIDRRENDGNYEPSNCRWATNKEQTNNKRNNTIIEYNGLRLTVAQWADRLALNPDTTYRRLYRGWSAEQTLTETRNKKIKRFFGKDHWLSKPVIQKSGNYTVGVFEGAGDAARKTGLKLSSIKAACVGRLKTYKGYTWQYFPIKIQGKNLW